jgi:hypothetical protein
MSGISDLLRELYILKANIESGQDIQSAFAGLTLPLADVSETQNDELVAQRPNEDDETIDALLSQMRGDPRFQEQEVYPVDGTFYARITDGSITRSAYAPSDGEYEAWEEVALKAGSTEETVTDGLSGDSTHVLVDINQHNSLPDDTVVKVFAFGYSSGTFYYYFNFEGWGTKASPTTVHTDPKAADATSWDADDVSDGVETLYCNIDFSVATGTSGSVLIHKCQWTETTDSEGHKRLVGAENWESVFWQLSGDGVVYTGCTC